MIGDPSFSTTIGTVTSTSVGVLVVLAGYLLGAIPFALLVGRWQRGVDIRRYGSGNLGTTNVLRTMGWKASAIVFVLDNAKSFVPVIVARALTGSAWWASAAALASVGGFGTSYGR